VNHVRSKSDREVLRHACFLGLAVLSAIVFRRALWTVLGSSLDVDKYSHILLVAPVSAALLYPARKKVLAQASYSKVGGFLLLLLLAAFAYASTQSGAFSESGYLSLSFLFFVAWCLAAFVCCYGVAAFRAAPFPLLFSLLMVPLPDWVLERTIAALQNGSADATCLLLQLAHIPYVRNGVVLDLPKVSIYIAEECSGIRSSMVLLLSTLVLGHLYLKQGWTQALLVLAAFPLTVARNGLRIFVLSTLGMYVDPSFLSGRLHRDGGFIFFAMAFAGILMLIWLFQKLGLDPGTAPPPPAPATVRVKPGAVEDVSEPVPEIVYKD
jgi:exosortase